MCKSKLTQALRWFKWNTICRNTKNTGWGGDFAVKSLTIQARRVRLESPGHTEMLVGTASRLYVQPWKAEIRYLCGMQASALATFTPARLITSGFDWVTLPQWIRVKVKDDCQYQIFIHGHPRAPTPVPYIPVKIHGPMHTHNTHTYVKENEEKRNAKIIQVMMMPLIGTFRSPHLSGYL